MTAVVAVPVMIAWSPAVQADIAIVRPASDWVVTASGNTALTGVSVSGFGSDSILLSIALSNAGGTRLKFTYGSGRSRTNLTGSTPASQSVTLTYGYCDSTSGTQNGVTCTTSNAMASFTRIAVVGSQDSVNTLLGMLEYVGDGTSSGTPLVVINATVNVQGTAYFFDGTNDHYYRALGFPSTSSGSLPAGTAADPMYYCNGSDDSTFVTSVSTNSGITLQRSATGSANCTWSVANRLARASTFKGQRGYLANITSADENSLLSSALSGATNVWMGGTDGDACGNTSYTQATNLSDTEYRSSSFVTVSCTAPQIGSGPGVSAGAGSIDGSSNDTGGTEGAWRWYDGPEAGTVFWKYLNFGATSWRTWASGKERVGYDFTSSNVNGSGSSSTFERPGYTNWCWSAGVCYEPNNSSSIFTFGGVSSSQQGEDSIVFNWNSNSGTWNDLHESEPTVGFYGFIVEYGGLGDFTGVLRVTKPILYTTPTRTMPTVVPVDPRATSVNLPSDMAFSGPSNALMCINESDSSGNVLASPAASDLLFDVDTKGSSDNATGSNAVRGDRSSAVQLQASTSNVTTRLNGSGGLQAYLTTGSLSASRYVRIRTIALSSATATAADGAACGNFSSGASQTIELRPYDLTQTVQRGTVTSRS